MVAAGVAVIVIAAAAGSAIALFGKGTAHRTPRTVSSATPGASPTPARPSFVFALDQAVAVSTHGRNGQGIARDSAVEIDGLLSAFYDRAFLDPATWSKGLPASAWEPFDPSVRSHAMKDAGSLTLGPDAARVAELTVTHSSLSVRVLFDPAGSPIAAVADVAFHAAGRLGTGQQAEVSSAASFLLRVDAGQWVIVGYPSANTTLDAASPSPSPSPPSASPSPSAGVTP